LSRDQCFCLRWYFSNKIPIKIPDLFCVEKHCAKRNMDITKFYTISRDLPHHGLICPPKTSPGLYILDILVIVTWANSYLNCLHMCLKYDHQNQRCSAADYVTKFEGSIQGLCVLHGTSLGHNGCAFGWKTIVEFCANIFPLHAWWVDDIFVTKTLKSEYRNWIFVIEVNRDPNHNSLITSGTLTSVCGMPVFQDKNTPKAFPSTLQRKKRVIDGYIAEPYSHPWIGIVMLEDRYLCGVSLIKQNQGDDFTHFGLTAAHCFEEYFRNQKT